MQGERLTPHLETFPMQQDIVKALRSILSQRNTITGRIAKASTRVQELQAALAEAEATLTTLETENRELLEKGSSFAKLFPEEAAQAEADVQATGSKTAPAVVSNQDRHQNTIVGDMRLVMGTQVMRAGQVVEALRARGLERQSTNFQGYISTLLSNHDLALIENGQRVVVNGKPQRVKVFEKVARGAYRVSPPFVIPDGTSAVTMSNMPATDLLRKHGLSEQDIPSATV